jgi:hypothetical protein
MAHQLEGAGLLRVGQERPFDLDGQGVAAGAHPVQFGG